MLTQVLDLFYPLLSKKEIRPAMRELIDIFGQQDCDTMHESFDKAWPELEEEYRKLFPDEFEDDEDDDDD